MNKVICQLPSDLIIFRMAKHIKLPGLLNQMIPKKVVHQLPSDLFIFSMDKHIKLPPFLNQMIPSFQAKMGIILCSLLRRLVSLLSGTSAKRNHSEGCEMHRAEVEEGWGGWPLSPQPLEMHLLRN